MERIVSNQTSSEDRLKHVEQALRDSASDQAKWEVQLQKCNELRVHHHAALLERFAYLESLVRDSVDKSAQSTIDKLEKEIEVRTTSHLALQLRVDHLESVAGNSLGHSVGMHTKAEAAHSNSSKLQEKLESRTTHHADLLERVEHLDTVFGDFNDKHAKWEDAHTKLSNANEELFAKLTRDVDQRIEANHASLKQRVDQIEHELGETLERAAREATAQCAMWEAAHADMGKLRNEHEMRDSHHAALRERVEGLVGVTADKQRTTKEEAPHDTIGKLQEALEARTAHQAALVERVEYIENKLGDFTSRHAKYEAAHVIIGRLQKELEASPTRALANQSLSLPAKRLARSLVR